MHSTMQEASYLSLSAMAERTDKHRSITEGLSFRSLLNAAVKGGQTDRSVSHRQNDGEIKSFIAAHDFLCKGDTSAAYQAYTQHIRNFYPYIELARLEAAYQNILDAHSKGTASIKASTSPEHFVVIYLGLATGTLLSPGYERYQQIAEDLVECSLEAFNYVLDVGDDLATVHCLIALTICSLFLDKAGSTWHLLGLAMTRGVACGMHTAKELRPETQANPTEHARTFWALFLLDTRVSCALDRPFYLEDSAVAMPKSLSPDENLNNLVAQARMMRAMRQPDRGEALCTFINLQHLHETIASRCALKEIDSVEAYAAGLVELFKYSVVTESSNCRMIVTETAEVFTKFLVSFEDQLISKTSAPTSLDGVLVLAIGAILCRLHATAQIAQQQAAYQAINILTLLSTRYSYARDLRDILMELLVTAVGTEQQQPSARLRDLTDKVELQLPSRIENMILTKKPL